MMTLVVAVYVYKVIRLSVGALQFGAEPKLSSKLQAYTRTGPKPSVLDPRPTE